MTKNHIDKVVHVTASMSTNEAVKIGMSELSSIIHDILESKRFHDERQDDELLNLNIEVSIAHPERANGETQREIHGYFIWLNGKGTIKAYES
jgi:HD superfamily phosphodiesterase